MSQTTTATAKSLDIAQEFAKAGDYLFDQAVKRTHDNWENSTKLFIPFSCHMLLLVMAITSHTKYAEARKALAQRVLMRLEERFVNGKPSACCGILRMHVKLK